jgi:hypothetical protein
MEPTDERRLTPGQKALRAIVQRKIEMDKLREAAISEIPLTGNDQNPPTEPKK